MMVGQFSLVLLSDISTQQQLGKENKNSIKSKSWNELITFE